MKRLTLSILLILWSFASFGQGEADSMNFCNSQNWKRLNRHNNLVVKELTSKQALLFGSPEHIYIMEIPSEGYRLEPTQLTDRERTSYLQRALGGVASINGGFFVVNPERRGAAVANDFLKINGRVLSPDPCPGWGQGAVGIDSSGKLHFAHWSKAMEADTISGWSAQFSSVMVAGPILILDGATVPSSDPSRHPRTAIGTRPDGTIVLMVIDGRRRRAAGATFSEMSTIGRWLGLTDMLNLDGGGSSTMIYRNRLINFPSDGQGIIPLQRKVANALVVLSK